MADYRFVAYDHLGDRRGVLSNYLSATPIRTWNELPTLTLTYPRRAAGHEWLQNNPEVAMEYWGGNGWYETHNCRWVLQGTSLNYNEEVETIEYNFIGIGEVGKHIYIYDATGLSETAEGKIEFKNMTPETILAKIWDRAEARGWNKTANGGYGYLSIWNDGNPITRQISITFDRDTSFDTVLNYFVRAGLINYSWQQRWMNVENQAYNNKVFNESDPNPIRLHLSGGPAGVDSAPEQTEHPMGLTHIIIIGEDQRRFVVTNPSAKPADARRELFLQHGGVRDQYTAEIVAAPTFERYNRDQKNTTRQFQLNDPRVTRGAPSPGDWALVEKADGVWEPMRVRQYGLTINQNGVQGYVSMGDKVDSVIEKMDTRLQRLQSGLS